MTAKSLLPLLVFLLFLAGKIWRLLLLQGTGVTSNPYNNMYFISSPTYTIGIDLITEAEPALLTSFSFAVALFLSPRPVWNKERENLENKVTVLFLVHDWQGQSEI